MWRRVRWLTGGNTDVTKSSDIHVDGNKYCEELRDLQERQHKRAEELRDLQDRKQLSSEIRPPNPTEKQTNSVAFSLQANYTDWSTATFRRNLVPTFVDRWVSRGERGGSRTVVNLSFLDRSRYFSFK
jgi:hypothetical protein